MPRRSNDAGLIQLPNGRWQGRLQVNGQRHAVYGKSKAEAKAKLDILRRQAITNGGLPEAGHTVGTLLDAWLACGDWKPRTIADYQHHAGLIRQGLGENTALAKLTPSRIQGLYATLKASPRKALYCHQVLHAACKRGVQWGWLPVNPCDRVARPGYHKVERQLWTPEQCRAFLAGTTASEYWPLWTLALTTGCRYGELIGLRWADVDGERQTLHVARSLQRIRRQWVETEPKTRSGKRTIHIAGLAVQAIGRQWAIQAEWRLKAGTEWQDVGRIFTNRHGGPLEGSTVRDALLAACKALGLPAISMHSFRHMAASLALGEGVPLTLVSRNLGHANTAITATTYGHALADSAAAAEAIGRALAR